MSSSARIAIPSASDDGKQLTYDSNTDTWLPTNGLDDHLVDAVGAHVASAISVTPTGQLAAITVQAALAELGFFYKATGLSTSVGAGLANRAAIQAQIDRASAAGGGNVFIPEGRWPITTNGADGPIEPKSNVGIYGAGIGRTVLLPYGHLQCFWANASTVAPTTDVVFANFEIDGINQSHTSYVSSMKGIQCNYAKRHTYQNLYIHHCGATGMGSDYLYDSLMDHIIADYNGRLATPSDAGGAGIGIGTGAYAVENLTVRDCITRNNGVHGVFWESQGGVESTGMALINHYSANNGLHGIAECGVDRLRVVGGQSRANGSAGFAAWKGTYVGATGPGKNTHIVGLECLGNTGHGFYFDGSVDGIDGTRLENCRSIGNGLNGVAFVNADDTATGLAILDCDISNNQLSGIKIDTATGGVIDVVIDGNQIVANGRNTGSGGVDRAAIYLKNSVQQLRITNNRAWDSQGSKTQTYGIYCGTATLTGGEIDGNDFAQNLTGGVNMAGATFSSFRVGRNNAWTINTGTPEGSVIAPVGAMYFRLDGGAGATLYVKETGSGNTGWAAK